MQTITFTSYKSFKAKVELEYTQDKTAGTSTITVKQVGIIDGSGETAYGRSAKCSVTIAGKTAASCGWHDLDVPGTWWYLLPISRTNVTVTHDADGKAAPKLSLSWNISGADGTYTDINQTDTGTVTLDTIQKAAQVTPEPSTISAGSMTLGKAGTIQITRSKTGVTEKITASVGSYSTTISSSNSSSSVNWTPPLDLARQKTDGTTVSVVLQAESFYGGKSIGKKTATVSCAMPDSVKPSISSLSVSDAAGHLAVCGSYIQGKSLARVQTTAAGSYGSTIKSIAVKVGKLSKNGSDVTMELPDPGTITVSVTATDSRGRTDTKTQNISVTAYSAPTVRITSLSRCNADGTNSSQGSYFKAVWTSSATSIKGSSVSYSAYWKAKGDANGTETAITGPSGTVIKWADPDKTYDVCVKAKDRFSSAESVNWILPVAFVLMDFDRSKRGVGIGARAGTANALNVGLDLRMNGKRIEDVGSLKIGSTELSEEQLKKLLKLI